MPTPSQFTGRDRQDGMARKVELPPAPDLSGQLAKAQQEARKAREASDVLQSQFEAAVAEERFDDAKALKDQLSPAHGAATLAEAHAKALADVTTRMQAEHAERERTAQAEFERAQAREHLAVATEAEQAALEAVQRHFAEAQAGLDAVRASLAKATAAETEAWQARSDAQSALVTLGERPDGMRMAKPNFASSRIEASALLTAIVRGRSR